MKMPVAVASVSCNDLGFIGRQECRDVARNPGLQNEELGVEGHINGEYQIV